MCRNADTLVIGGLRMNFSRETEEWEYLTTFHSSFGCLHNKPFLQSCETLPCKARPNHCWKLNAQSPIGPLGVPSDFSSAERKCKFWTERNLRWCLSILVSFSHSSLMYSFKYLFAGYWVVALVGKNPLANAGEPGSIPGLGRSPGGGYDTPLQYSCLEVSMHRGAWQATVCEATKSWTWLSESTRMHAHTGTSRVLSTGDMKWKNVGMGPALMELTNLREILLMASEPGLG